MRCVLTLTGDKNHGIPARTYSHAVLMCLAVWAWLYKSCARVSAVFAAMPPECSAWNNGSSGAKLDLTSSTTPGLQIHVIGCCVAMRSYWSAVPTPLFIYISQLLRDSFSVSQQPPIWEPPSHYSMSWSLSTFTCLLIFPIMEFLL